MFTIDISHLSSETLKAIRSDKIDSLGDYIKDRRKFADDSIEDVIDGFIRDINNINCQIDEIGSAEQIGHTIR